MFSWECVQTSRIRARGAVLLLLWLTPPHHCHVSPLQGLERPCSTLVLVASHLGGCPPQRPPCGCPEMARLVGPRPGHLGPLSTDNRAFQVSSEEAKQNNPHPCLGVPSCPLPALHHERISCPGGYCRTAVGASNPGGRGLGLEQDSRVSSDRRLRAEARWPGLGRQ